MEAKIAQANAADEEEGESERPYAWVLPALPAEAERVVVALQQRQWERSRSTWWRRAAPSRLAPLDREMAAVRELRELATAVLDRRGGNRYGAIVPVSEVLLLLSDPVAWRELLTLSGIDRERAVSWPFVGLSEGDALRHHPGQGAAPGVLGREQLVPREWPSHPAAHLTA